MGGLVGLDGLGSDFGSFSGTAPGAFPGPAGREGAPPPEESTCDFEGGSRSVLVLKDCGIKFKGFDLEMPAFIGLFVCQAETKRLLAKLIGQISF